MRELLKIGGSPQKTLSVGTYLYYLGEPHKKRKILEIGELLLVIEGPNGPIDWRWTDTSKRNFLEIFTLEPCGKRLVDIIQEDNF